MSSTRPCVLSLGTAVPEHVFTKDDFIQFQQASADAAIAKLDPKNAFHIKRINDIRKNCKWVQACAENSQIDQRYSCVDMMEYYSKFDWKPSMQETGKQWRTNAPKLTMQAVQQALQKWGGNKDQITHVVSHSTTGWELPGLSHHVMEELDLPETCRGVPLGFIGCHGGANILWVGTQIVKQNPNAVVLVVSCELSSIHISRGYDEVDLNRSKYLPHVLFGDGAAAAIIGEPKPNVQSDFPIFELGYMGSHYIPDTHDVYSMKISEQPGLYTEPQVGKDLPFYLNSTLEDNLNQWLRQTVSGQANDIDFAIHPDGRLLLDDLSVLLERHCNVKDGKDKLRYCYDSLRKVGNLGSVSIFFVLEDLITNTTNDEIYVLAMGPGITLEYAGMRRYDPSRPTIITSQNQTNQIDQTEQNHLSSNQTLVSTNSRAGGSYWSLTVDAACLLASVLSS